LLTVWRLRGEAPEVIFKAANVGMGREREAWKESRVQLLSLAARIKAADAVAFPFVRWGLRRLGVDLNKAVVGLEWLSSRFYDFDGSRELQERYSAERVLYQAAVEDALRLPRTDSDEVIGKIKETLASPRAEP
jgi:hypothetical protein